MNNPAVENSASRTPKVRALLLWSTGNDAAWTLHQLRQSDQVEVVALLTTTDAMVEYDATHIAFGDLYLEEVRADRERLLEPVALQPLFPPTIALSWCIDRSEI